MVKRACSDAANWKRNERLVEYDHIPLAAERPLGPRFERLLCQNAVKLDDRHLPQTWQVLHRHL